MYRGGHLGTLDNHRGKIESTEVKFVYPRKITEAEFWLMLHPDYHKSFSDDLAMRGKRLQTTFKLYK